MPDGSYTPRVDPQFGGSTALNALAPLINSLTAGPGTLPGQFRPSQSYYDRFQGGQYSQGMDLAIRQAAQYDRGPQMDLMRGIARVAGRPWGAEQERGAGKVADDLARLGPQLTQLAPQTFDQLHGTRGSAQVMTAEVFDASRFIRDPHTGRTGLAANQASWLSNQLYGGLYGPGADVSKMNGLRAGEAGGMFKEMTQRGMTGGADMLTGRGIEQTRDRLKNMSGAVRAMRDVFGEMGRPDAPMQEIFDGLDKLTQGGLATRSPAEVHAVVRRTQALAHLTGTSVEAMAAGTDRGAAMARSVGLDRQFGVATQMSSTSFGQAWATQAGPQGFGGLNREQATALDQRLRTAAASSATANRMGATAKMAEAGLVPGLDMSTAGLDSRDPAVQAQARQRYAANQAKLQGLVAQAGAMSPQQWQQFMESRGVTAGVASNFLAGREANQEAVLRYGLQDRVREMQGGEIGKTMSGVLGGGARATLGRLGASPQQTAQLTGVIGDAIRDALVRMDPALLADPARAGERNAAVKQALQAALRARGVNLPDAALNEVVANAIQSLDQRVRSDPNLKQFGNMNGLIAMNRGDVLGQGNRNLQDADRAARQAAGTAGVGQQPPLARISDAVQGARPGDGLGTIAGQALGAITADAIPGGQPRGPGAIAGQALGAITADAIPGAGAGPLGFIGRALNGPGGEAGTALSQAAGMVHRGGTPADAGVTDMVQRWKPGDAPTGTGVTALGASAGGGNVNITGTLTLNADNTATINGTSRPGNVPAP